MTRAGRAVRLVFGVIGVAVVLANSGCIILDIQRRVLQLDVAVTRWDISRLSARNRQMETELKQAKIEAEAALYYARSEREKLDHLRARQEETRGETRRLAGLCGSLDRQLADARKQAQAAQAAPKAPSKAAPKAPSKATLENSVAAVLLPADRRELRKTAGLLMKLEAWVATQKEGLAADKADRAAYTRRSERLRAQACLLAMAQLLKAFDLRSQVESLQSQLAGKLDFTNLLSLALRYDELCAATAATADIAEHSSVLVRHKYNAVGSCAAHAELTARRYVAGEIAKLEPYPQMKALRDECTALITFLEHMKVVCAQAVTSDGGAGLRERPAQKPVAHVIRAMWTARLAADNGAGHAPSSGRMFRAVAQLEWIRGDQWNPETYLAGRIRAMQQQRSAIELMLAATDDRTKRPTADR